MDVCSCIGKEEKDPVISIALESTEVDPTLKHEIFI
jgi:hypothetical protein